MTTDTIVILAAGEGKRMKSALPKPLHPVGGRAMLGHVLETASKLNPGRVIVVVSDPANAVTRYASNALPDARICVQSQPLGTGHAVRAAAEHLRESRGETVVLFADSPLIEPDTIRAMSRLRRESGSAAVFLALRAEGGSGYGQFRLNPDGTVAGITECADAQASPAEPVLANGGVVCADSGLLLEALVRLDCDNAAGEYYLTAVAEILAGDGHSCRVHCGAAVEALGVNARGDLARVEAAFQERARDRAMAAGVTMPDPGSVRFSHDTRIDADVTIEPHVYLGTGVRILSRTRILSFCALEGCEIGHDAQIGPHARIRPDTRVGDRTRIGNYVEIKQSTIGDDSRIGHLAYVGDAQIGQRVNVGAGAITCNYDGTRKHRTTIHDDAFIGSNVSLVAPVEIGAGAYVGSGSVITENVAPNALALSRGRQREIPKGATRIRSLRKPTSK